MATSHLLLQAKASFTSPSPPPAWSDDTYDGHRVYIHTVQDKAIPALGQEMLVKNSGVSWDVRHIDSSHSPFISQPGELSAMIDSVMKSWSLLM